MVLKSYENFFNAGIQQSKDKTKYNEPALM